MYPHFLHKTLEPILTVACPAVVCILIGLITFGTQVFYLNAPPFQFCVIGLAVGILVLAAQRQSLIQSAGITILITIAMIVATGSWSPRLIPRVIILVLILAGAVLLNVKIFSRALRANIAGQFITWSIIFILAYLLHGVILLIIFRPAQTTSYLRMYGQYAVLIGIGLGVGFKVKEWLIQKLRVDKPHDVAGGDGV